MDIYDMMKKGMTQEEIFNAFKEESKNARETIAKEEAEAQAKVSQAEKDALKGEARAYVINAVAAYSNAYDLGELTEENAETLEETIIDFEEQLEAFIPMLKSLADIAKRKEKKAEIEISTLNDEVMEEAIRSFLDGLK